MGSVTPLIAWWQELAAAEPDLQTKFIGTIAGPEKELIKYYKLPYFGILAGKFRRYLSWRNLLSPLEILLGFIEAFFYLAKFRPDVALGAGSYVCLPALLAAKLLGAKVIIHQLDIKPTLTNRLLTLIADRITVTFPESLKNFPAFKTRLIGGLVRQEVKIAKRKYTADDAKQKLVVMGGGTGALDLNKLLVEAKKFLPHNLEIYHLVGKGKQITSPSNFYHPHELEFTNHYDFLAAADLVVSRAGLASLLELSYLAKPTIVIPLPFTQQEDNARYFCANNSAVYLEEKKLTPSNFAEKILALLDNKEKLKILSKGIAEKVNFVDSALAVSLVKEIL